MKNLFSIKTKNGYGLFQEYDSVYNIFGWGGFYIIYYAQVKSQEVEDILKAMQSEYYYARIGFDIWDKSFSKEVFLNNIGKEITNTYLGIEDKDPYYGNCKITYLGKFPIPSTAKIPRFSRELNMSKLSGTYKWLIYDEEKKEYIQKNNKILSLKKLNEETSLYPDYYVISPLELLERFNNNYNNTKGDFWVEKFFEEFYRENPHLRPINAKYDDIKYPLPTAEWLAALEQKDNDYIQFCNKIESALNAFISKIDENHKAVQKPLLELISTLNSINKGTQLIGTLEAETLYLYIVKILKTLKKTNLIDLLENNRLW